MDFSEYRMLDGVALGQLIESGAISARQAAETAIKAIERLNPIFNAVVITDFERAVSAIDETARGPLAGVPFLLKDVNLYSDFLPTRFASRYFRDARPRPDSTMVRRWRDAGLTILGKTNTPEFAAEFVTEPGFYGRTLNPWNRSVTVGGSSGGAAAAVASGMVPVAHATDLGGSIRIPAACCGIFGFKPTSGLNPVGPYFEKLSSGLNSDHVLSWSVRDSAASLDVTAEHGPDGPGSSWLGNLSHPTGALRIGMAVSDASGTVAGANQVEAVERTARALERLGHVIVDYRFPEQATVGGWFDHLWVPDILDLIEDHARQTGRDPQSDALEPLTWEALARIRAAGPEGIAFAKSMMAITAAAYLDSMAGIDLLLTPALARDPAPLGQLSYIDSGCDYDRWNDNGYAFAPYSILANISGQPSAACPVMIAGNGLPIAIQIAGRPGQDMLVLQVSRQLEEFFGWQSHRNRIPEY
jgi:amidase